MKLKKIFRTAWEGLMLNKVRSFLTTLGVIIGVASVIVMLAVSAGAEASIAEQINALGANLIIVSPMRGIPGAGRTLLIDDAYAIAEQVVGIDGISAEQSPAAQNVRAGGVTLESIPIIGTTADFSSVRDYAVAEGRYFTADEDERKAKVVILGSGIAADLFGTESAVGQTITVDSTKLTVIGVMESKGLVADVDYDGRVYLPINLVFQKFMTASPMGTDAVRTIYLKSESQEQIDSVIAQTTAILAERHDVDPAKPDFTVQTQQDIIATQEATTAAFRDLLAWVAAISLLVGGIGIMNIMLVSVTERTREIGLRMAVGARGRDILVQFLIEAVTLSLAGGAIGIALGAAATWGIAAFSEWRVMLSPASVALAAGFAAAIGIFFGWYPARRAARLLPIEALRHE